MKRNILLLLLILFSINVMSQEKGSYITLWGGVGPTGYKYAMPNVDFAAPVCQLKLGGQAGIGYSYYFTQHWGISTGIGASLYRTHGKFNEGFQDNAPFILGSYVDNDPFDDHVTSYDLRVRTKDWVEQQKGYFLEVPLMINFQTKFGENEYWGIYLGAGAKFQLPLGVKYSIIDGNHEGDKKLNVSGYYAERNLELGGPNNPGVGQHGFASMHNPSEVLANSGGDLNFKINISAVGEAGFLFSLGRRVDMTLGAFIDYGLLNIRKDEPNTPLFVGPDSDYTGLGQDYNIANGIIYNSMITSEFVNKNGDIVPIMDKVSTLSYGGKIGIRIKLGKLREKPEAPACENDTIFIYVVEESPEEEKPEVEQPAAGQGAGSGAGAAIVHPESKYDNGDIYILLEPIYFDLDKSTLRKESIDILNRKVEILKAYPEISLVIMGNTCDLGKDPYNYKLGQRRADIAMKYLVDRGISKDRLKTITQSRFEPEMPNTSEFNRSHNRRTDFRPEFK